MRAAEDLLRGGRYEQAARLYEAHIKDHPNDPAAYEGLAQAFDKLGRSADAAVAYEKEAALLEKSAASGQPAAAPRPVTAAGRMVAAAQPTAKPAVPGRIASGKLDGLYFMTRFWVGSGLETAAYYFQNGVVVLNPAIGGKNLDVAAERAVHPKGVGTYRLIGEQLTLTFDGSNKTAKFIDDKQGCFEWDTGSFCHVEIFKPGTTLNGTFTGGASVGGGALMSSTDITFKPDGSYQRGSAASFSATGRTTASSGGATSQEQGKYRIDGIALHLMPDGGKETVVTTFPYDDGTTGPAPRKIYFGGGMLSRK
ncbi:MAG: hypothetical protein NVSMB6_30420 [Burkholderiaceae bacterium]